MPAVSSLVALAAAASAQLHDTRVLGDLERALETSPRPHLVGFSPAGIRAALNGHLEAAGHAACDAFTNEDLDELLDVLDGAADARLLAAYAEADGRHGARSNASLPAARGDAAYDAALRDVKCFRVAMKHAHHLSSAAKDELRAAGLRFPRLPGRGAEELAAALGDGHDDLLASTLSCQTGHNGTALEPGHWKGYPDWPDEVEYEARGYGPYPFWYAGSASTGAYDGPGGLIQTKWSGLLNAEKLSHGACTLPRGDAPCTMLFRDKWAYLYRSDESGCCIASTPRLPNCWMGPVKRDFYKLFDDHGLDDTYSSESGLYDNSTVRNYTLVMTSNEGFYFWYQTDAAGFPVEQGEGGAVRPRAKSGPPKYLFHQFNRSTFGPPKTPFDADTDFAVPDVCKNTTAICTVSPTSLCDATPPDF